MNRNCIINPKKIVNFSDVNDFIQHTNIVVQNIFVSFICVIMPTRLFIYVVKIIKLISHTNQIDYIRRRQHISTIDTNSPTRGLLSHQGTPPSQTYVPTGMQMHTPMGYCTLRNGTKQSANIGPPVSMVS